MTYVFKQVSYTPAGVTEDVLGNHFQLYPSERNLALALVAVVKEYGWRQLSILTQNEQPFIQVSAYYNMREVISIVAMYIQSCAKGITVCLNYNNQLVVYTYN